MRKIIKYKVADKEFISKKDALEYEEKLRNDLHTRALNLVANFWESYSYPSHELSIRLINNFCDNRKISLGTIKDVYIGEELVTNSDFIKRWLKTTNVILTEKDKLINEATKEYNKIRLQNYGVITNFPLLNWEKEEMKQI